MSRWWYGVGLALLAIGGCQRQRAEHKAPAKPAPIVESSRDATGTSLASAARLPEDPIAGERAVSAWRQHQQEEERDRKANYDRRRMTDHRAVVAFLRSARQGYDQAKSVDAVLRVQKGLAPGVAKTRARVEKIDHWRVSSNLLADYDALLASLMEPYPAACASALSGSSAALDAQRAEADARFRKIEEWLAYAEKAEEE